MASGRVRVNVLDATSISLYESKIETLCEVRDVQCECRKLQAVRAHHFRDVEDRVAYVLPPVRLVCVRHEARAAPHLKVPRRVAVKHQPPLGELEVGKRACVWRLVAPEHFAAVDVERAYAAVHMRLDEAVFKGAGSAGRRTRS